MFWLNWLRANSLKVYILSFLIMVISAILMLAVARQVEDNLVWVLIALFALANLLMIGTRP